MRNEKTFCVGLLGYASRHSGASFFITGHLFQPGITGWGSKGQEGRVGPFWSVAFLQRSSYFHVL